MALPPVGTGSGSDWVPISCSVVDNPEVGLLSTTKGKPKQMMKFRMLLIVGIIFPTELSLSAQQTTLTTPKVDDPAISYGIVADNSGSLRPLIETIELTAKTLFTLNGQNDETFVVRFIGRDKIERVQDFTTDYLHKLNVSAENFL